MKKMISFLLLLHITQFLSANVSAIFAAGGTISPRKDTEIQLVKEDIYIRMENTFSVELRYELYNHGETDTITIGFPRWYTIMAESPSEFSHLEIYVDGNKIDYIRELHKNDKSGEYYKEHIMEPIIYDWYMFTHTFENNEKTNITITYEAEYGRNGFSRIAEYLFGTGSTWYARIRELNINIDIGESIWIKGFSIAGISPPGLQRTGNKKFRIQLNDIEPKYLDVIRFDFDHGLKKLLPYYFHFYDSDKSLYGKYNDLKLDDKELFMLSLTNLKMYKAFFHAVAGYPCMYTDIIEYFKDNDIKPVKAIRNYENWKYNVDLLDEYIGTAEAAKSEIINYNASSFIDYQNKYDPSVVFDNNPATGWLEGVKGPGKGEFVSIQLSSDITVDEIKIAPGYFDPKWWDSNNRVKKLLITLDDHEFTVGFQDIMKVHKIDLKTPITFTFAKFTILDVYPSNKDDDTGISEITFYYKNEKIQL